MIDNLILGFGSFLTIQNILFCLLGCVIGTVVGVLPGFGTVATLSMLLPYLYGLDPITSMILLAGIYYGANYGGSTTSILLNTPGEPSSIITCIDGHAMTKKGLAGNAIFAAGLSSFIAGCITVLIIAFLGTVLSKFGFLFGSAETCNLMLLGILSLAFVTNKDIITGFALGCIGMWLGFVGTDTNTGSFRFTLGIVELSDGIGIGILAIGIFGIAEVIKNILHPPNSSSINQQLKMRLSKEDVNRLLPSSLRGTAVGSILGLIPGGGAVMASFISYVVEKKFSKHKTDLGNGAIEGVAGPEAANNAAAQMNFIPLLILGIPENAVMALMLGALLIAGIQPGPAIMEKQPVLFWALTCSMVFGNFILLILNVPFTKIWLNLLKIPTLILYPALLIISLLGAYSINNSFFDVYLASIFGLIGYAFYRIGLEPAPLVLGYIIGPLFEENARRALIISRGDFNIFYNSATATIILITIFSLLLFGLYKFVVKKQQP